MASHQQMQRYIEEMTLEKEELVRRHTIDTGDLRKKNAALLEHAHKFDAISMSAVPSSTGYSADFSDFEHLTMETSPWDHFAMANDFSVDAEPKHDTALVLPKKEKRPITEDEKSATSGLLLMLLLCGAWVTANHTATAPATIPRMPDEVRAASAVVLENIYHDAGLQPYPPAPSTSSVGRRESYHPSTTSMKTTLSAAEIASLSTSPLAALHHQLVTPSEEQQREQIFSLSTNQYHDLTSGECFDDPKPTTQPHRRNLGDALAAMRHDHRGSVAEAYTRSLMWDEVPTNVVRDFARMVAECNAGTVRPESGDCLS